MKNEKLNTLPKEIQEKIKDILKAYDEVHVTYEEGDYHFGLYLKLYYSEDFKVIGTFYAKDIFTDEERIINYIEQFHSYPSEYKGKKDWNMIHKIEGLRKNSQYAKIKLVEGNAVIDKILTL